MVDRQRVLIKLDELDGYLSEIKNIFVSDMSQYRQSAVKRACERLLQLSIETSIDICKKLVIGLKLGIPQDESDLFEKLRMAGTLSPEMLLALRRMKGLRNVLVHEYAEIDDNVVVDTLINRLGDFQKFKDEILQYLNKK